jgi:hypothetical protein
LLVGSKKYLDAMAPVEVEPRKESIPDPRGKEIVFPVVTDQRYEVFCAVTFILPRTGFSPSEEEITTTLMAQPVAKLIKIGPVGFFKLGDLVLL